MEETSGAWRRVVVVGGGVAGSLVAKSLQFHSDVTLIDPKEYFEIPWARSRAMVEPSFAKRSIIRHKDYLTNGRLVVSTASNISSNQVFTVDGRTIDYDYLVIATGHDELVAMTRSERLAEFRFSKPSCALHLHYTEHERIRSATTILIAGGGPTGVELAAEIAVDFPAKKVILVHSGPRLLEFIGAKAGEKALEWLKLKHVEVKLNRSVDVDNVSYGNKIYRISSGENIAADCAFRCTGKPPASAWLVETVLKDAIDGSGRVRVDENLRVEGFNNVFAVGDITDVKELKQGFFAQKHAKVVVNNLKMLMAGGKRSKMVSYNKAESIKVFVSLGRHDGLAQFPLTTLIGLVPGWIKSNDLFVGRTRNKLDLDPYRVDS